MTQLFQNAIAVYKHFHKPDLFLTMTANLKWPEIIHSLFSGQTAIFGISIVYIYIIEFQKRGLSYIHLLIFILKIIFKILII